MEIQGIPTALGPNDADDGDAGRQIRGMAIAAVVAIQKVNIGYKVPSQSGNGNYIVSIGDTPFCSCPDYERRQQPCKHLYGVWCLNQREEMSIGRPDDIVQETTESKPQSTEEMSVAAW